ncbi:MAG: precorrin-6A/cobalt-precorrin-6A reductase, partial [Enterobacterales bacterium]|nr:precorrin-6A/cobalt-precorrin-6A reductase [Enterobacterales bacterium]
MFYNSFSGSNAADANTPTLHVFGGTSDARHICQRLDEMGLSYSLSVATDAGRELAGNINGEIIVGRMDAAQMSEWLRARRITQVIDASHPYAGVLSANIAHACATQNIALMRYLRPSEIDALEHPLLHKVASVEEACVVAHRLGERILLTTGSKQLADFVRLLAGKTLFARVLPTPDVLLQCQD